MAEAFAIAAAALQVCHLSASIVSKISTLIAEAAKEPDFLRQALIQVQSLLELAHEAWTSSSPNPNTLDGPAYEPNDSERTKETDTRSNGISRLWLRCSSQASEVERILDSLLKKHSRGKARNTITSIWTKREEIQLRDALISIERDKLLLSLHLGYTTCQNVSATQSSVANLRDDMAHLQHIMELNLSLTKHLAPCSSYEEPPLSVNNPEMPSSSDSSMEQNISTPEPETAKAPQSSTRRSKKARRPKEVAPAPLASRDHALRLTGCRCVQTQHRNFRHSRSLGTLMIQSTGNSNANCPLHIDRPPASSETAIHFRRAIIMLGIFLHFSLVLYRRNRFPSIGVNLRIQRRIENHPLEYEISEILCYRWRRFQGSAKDGVKRWQNRSDLHFHMYEGLRKMLLQAFDSGLAHPDDVDSEGCTLLHVCLPANTLSQAS